MCQTYHIQQANRFGVWKEINTVTGRRYAIALGCRLAARQPGESFRVCNTRTRGVTEWQHIVTVSTQE